MTAVRRALCGLWLSACALGCGSDPDALTQIEITVDSDLDVPDELDRVAIAVSGMVTDEAASADLREQPLPRHLTLVHEGGPLGPVRVTVTGFRGRSQVVERVVQTRFERGKLVMLAIELERGTGTGDAGEDGGEDGGELDAGTDAATDSGTDAATDSGTDADTDAGDSGSAVNEPPVCTIDMPLDGAALIAGQAVPFAGHCDDPETGSFDTGLIWSSDVENALCTGESCSATFDTPGARTLRLCAPDPVESSLDGCVAVSVTVGLPPPPTVSIDSVTQSGSGPPFTTGPAVVLAGSGDGQEIELVWRDTLVGEFGSGTAAALNGPMIGRHLVTLTATDNVGQLRQASATFVVAAQPGADLVQPFALTNTTLASAGGARIDALAGD